MAEQRSFTNNNFVLDIDGFSVGYLKKFSGLSMEADIAENKLGPDNLVKKNVANIKWTPGKATVGIGMGKGMYDWIKQAFDKSVAYKNGTLISADFDHKAASELTFNTALITSVTVPKMDGSAKENAYFDIEFAAEQVRWAKGDGKNIAAKLGQKQKAWLTSNFKFELAGLPCGRVSTIDSFTWKCSTANDMVGIFRENTIHAANVTVPDVKLSISKADYEPWAQAAKKWFVDGAHLEKDEMNGLITFLGPDMKTELGHIELKNVGFKSFDGFNLEGGSDAIARFNVTLYVEHMVFSIKEYDS